MRAELFAERLDMFEHVFFVEFFNLVLQGHLGSPDHLLLEFWHSQAKHKEVVFFGLLEIFLLE